MPAQLHVLRNSFSYAASYSRPAFGLWGQGSTVLSGLHNALHDLGVQLADFSFPRDGTVPSEQTVRVTLGDRSSLDLKLDRFEAAVRNYLDGDLEKLLEFAARSEAWLRSSVPDHSFSTRVVDLVWHCTVIGASAAELLRSLGAADRRIDAVSRGHGVNYHYEIPDQAMRFDLMIDHSLAVAGGLYLHFGLIVESDSIDYQQLLASGRKLLTQFLADIDLAFSPPSKQ